MATGFWLSFEITCSKPLEMVFRQRSRFEAFDGSVMGSTMNLLACIALKTRFVPPASRVMTMRSSNLYIV